MRRVLKRCRPGMPTLATSPTSPSPDHDWPAAGPARRHRRSCRTAAVVFDAGQNSDANFAFLVDAELHYVGSVPASDCGDLTALPAAARAIVDEGRFGGLTAHDTRRQVYGGRAAGHLDPLTRAARRPGSRVHRHHLRQDRQETRRAGRHPRTRQDPPATPESGSRDREDHPQHWVRRGVKWQLPGDQPKDLRLTWGIDQAARAALEAELFGKHVLITDHADWPAADVIAAYRSQSAAEFCFR